MFIYYKQVTIVHQKYSLNKSTGLLGMLVYISKLKKKTKLHSLCKKEISSYPLTLKYKANKTTKDDNKFMQERGEKRREKTIKYFIKMTAFVNQFHNQTKSTKSGNSFSLDDNI